MAVSSGVGPHAAWLNVGGAQFPIEHGNVHQAATRKSGTFSGCIPLSFPGAAELLANLGDNQATISVMTRGATSTLLTGEVDSTDFDLIGRVISFSGRDVSAKLHENKTSEKWLNKMPSDIVTDLIGRLGIGAGNITASSIKAGKQVNQDYVRLSDNVSFSYVIHRMSQIDGTRWWVDPNGMFHYVPLGTPQSIYTINVNQDVSPISADCIELKIKRNIQAGKGIAVTVKSWHPRKKQLFSYTSNVNGVGGPVNYSYDASNVVQDHVTKRAQSRAMERARHELTVSATVVGDPSVQAGMSLQLSGTNYFDQMFDIDGVAHDFGMGGHFTHITARSAKQGRSAS